MSIDTGLGPHWDQIVHMDLQPHAALPRYVGRVSSADPLNIVDCQQNRIQACVRFISSSGAFFGLESKQVFLLAIRNRASAPSLERS